MACGGFVLGHGQARIKSNTITPIGILINSFYMDICRRKFGACILAGLASRAIALPPRPKLLVLLVLEHLRPDYLDAVWSQVGPNGLRRIVEGGAFFPDCRHLASSFSSSTLATLATGAWPAQHGIVADTWYDRASRKPVRASDEALLATTLTSQVTAAPGTRAFVVSLNAPDGSLISGSSGARAYWMDEEGRFTSRGQLPDWVPDYNRARSLESLHNVPWVALGANPKAAGPAHADIRSRPTPGIHFVVSCFAFRPSCSIRVSARDADARAGGSDRYSGFRLSGGQLFGAVGVRHGGPLALDAADDAATRSSTRVTTEPVGPDAGCPHL